MKHLTLALLLCNTCYAADAAVADDQPSIAAAKDSDSDWFKAPDGYIWPAEAATQPTDGEQIRINDMPAALRTYLMDEWEPKPLPDSVYVRRADLNGDGKLEWFIDIPALGGTGGGYYDIITLTEKGVRSLGGLQGGFHLCVPAKDEKWLRIEASSRAGGMHVTRSLWQLIKDEYTIVRNEDHDYNAGKATVRK